LGAFNTENQEALKLTTFEYGKMRQILQKKSVQIFTTEQMRKLGSVELYNKKEDEYFYKI
jgi:hypothetical protein